MNKLYNKLTLQERAKMTFEALCFGDKNTANTIADSVPSYNYRSVDFDYKTPLDNYFSVAGLWSVE